jgi:hypothetical protein
LKKEDEKLRTQRKIFVGIAIAVSVGTLAWLKFAKKIKI